MTKAPERGENEITREAQLQALESGRDVCAVLRDLMRQAKKAKDGARIKRIQQAEKYLGCRNVKKRKKS